MGIKISACTIAKNEALNIGKSIESYKDYVDEIIIVDTGSIDETVEIASKLGAKVLNFEWKNDFAAAKNFALNNATGDWIVFLDADEWFKDDTAKNLQKVIEKTTKSNYKAAACRIINYSTETEIMETGTTIRIFKNESSIRFTRAIHEVLFDSNINKALPGLYTDELSINHSGYMKEILEKKARRNKALLDKNYALGNATPIDYFYGMRENLKSDTVLAEHFFKLIENTKDYDEAVSSFNVGSSIDENKIKLVNFLPENYSFDYRVRLLENIEVRNPKNPTFKFYEYMLFENIDKKRAIKALYDAIEYEKDYEKNNVANTNPFYMKRSNANSIIGEYELLINDRIKALEHFSSAIKYDYQNTDALKGLLAVISEEKTTEKVVFLNSLYDVSKKEVLKFLVDSLRTSEFSELFLYYFVDYYKKFNEVDLSFFTSRMITGNYEELIDTYINVYNESKDEKALLLITSAIVCGNCRDKFLEISNYITPIYSKILSSFFEENELETFSENSFQLIVGIFKEIAYIADKNQIKKLLKLYKPAKERLYFEIVKHYYLNYSYSKVLEWIEIIKEDNYLKNELEVYVNYLLVNIFYRTNDFEKLPESLDKVVKGGFLDQDICILCDLLEADDENLKEYYELVSDLSFAKKNINSNKLEDLNSDSIKFMTIDKFNDEIRNRAINLIPENLKTFFNFAKFSQSKKAYLIAEKFYKIVLKHQFNIDKCYLALGEIYNKLGKAELSFYCYENAFCENLMLAREILNKEHVNYNYVFAKKTENIITKCPICGEETKHINTYINLHDANLTYNDSMIVKYRECKNCLHIFAENEVKDKIYWEKETLNENSKDRISISYNILESLSEITDDNRILELDFDNGEFESAAANYGFEVTHDSYGEKFDIIMAGNLLNSTYSVEETIKKAIECLTDEGVIVFQVFDRDNAFSKFNDTPLWVRAGIKNVFSRKSMETLFEKLGLHILEMDVDKINEGQLILFLSKE